MRANTISSVSMLGEQIGIPQQEEAEYIRAYMERIKTDARRTGYVETIFGRECLIHGIATQSRAARRRPAAGDQCAAAGLGRRHHKACYGMTPPCTSLARYRSTCCDHTAPWDFGLPKRARSR